MTLRDRIALLLLLAAVHYGYPFAPHPWATFTAGLGALSAVLLWRLRGPRRGPAGISARWALCIWGAGEGALVAWAQAMLNFSDATPDGPFAGMFSAWLGVSTYWWGLGASALVAVLIYREAHHGR